MSSLLLVVCVNRLYFELVMYWVRPVPDLHNISFCLMRLEKTRHRGRVMASGAAQGEKRPSHE